MKSVKDMTEDEIIKHLKNGVITLNAKGLRDKKQTVDMCLAAVNKNGFEIQHVKEKTPEICLGDYNSLLIG